MMKEATSHSSHGTPVKILLGILRTDFVGLFEVIAPYIPKVFHRREGIYEVLDYDAQLTLNDSKGKLATFTKRQRVRFLQHNVIAYQDQAWGDGEIFADYRCAPGIAVDRYREGHKFRVLISLRETKNRNDVEDFYIERVVKGGFSKTTEDFQIEIDHPTHNLSMAIIFPRKRPPRQVKLIEQHAQRTHELDSEQIQQLPDRRWQVRWESHRLKLYEAYILRWEW
ncbi:MAG: hypothetical protein KC547_11015 [Anaerolineae bacterium]|nr:hypothetical protein [Anaerolineae bacterium]